ncbi:MAG: hypothetical protein Ta2E_03190 [Mycoplasmoidaceae bacterium]|nr:MAG: hypothetical protein Ta2E_03190 [Mycoplasmoidaceae bacterium]
MNKTKILLSVIAGMTLLGGGIGIGYAIRSCSVKTYYNLSWDKTSGGTLMPGICDEASLIFTKQGSDTPIIKGVTYSWQDPTSIPPQVTMNNNVVTIVPGYMSFMIAKIDVSYKGKVQDTTSLIIFGIK